MGYRDRVERVLAELGVEAEVAPLLRWIEQLARYNQRIDLTAARNDDELVDLMVADAALLAAQLAPDRALVDVGSGAGAPGLPLALLRPDLKVTLVEPMQKRAALLRMMATTLARGRAQVVQARGDALGESRFEVAVSRATLPPPDWLRLGSRLAPEVWVLLAREEPPALEGWVAADAIAYRWPLTGAARRAVVYRRARATAEG